MKKVMISLLFLVPFIAYAQNDKVTEICGVKFGSSISSAKAILEEKFGEAFNVSDESIIYCSKSYGGISFDFLAFQFTKSGSTTYLNQAAFTVLHKTKTEAEQERERIAEVLKRKYTLVPRKDSNGDAKYLGGTSPLNSNKCGFVLDISKSSILDSYPWSARLIYGGYGYGEEF